MAGLAEIELIGLRNPRHLSQDEWGKLKEAYMCYRCAWNNLAEKAIEKGLPRWHVRPKCHYLEHAILDFNGKNMRYMANFLDEDMIRRIKKMAVCSHPRFLAKHVMFRYCISATLKWTGMIK